MKNLIKALSVLLLALTMTLSMTSCDIILEILGSLAENPPYDLECTEHVDIDEDDECDICGVVVNPQNSNCTHKDNNGDGKCDNCGIAVRPVTPECTDHTDKNKDGKCDNCGIAVRPVTPECTEHTDKNKDGKCDSCGVEVQTGGAEILPDKPSVPDPNNPYSGLTSGFNISSDKVDATTHKVSSYYEADRIVDNAVANHYSEITIDFGPMGEAYTLEDYSQNHNYELNYTTISFAYYPSSPEVLTFRISYDTDTASFSLPKTEENTYLNYKNGNMVIRDALNGDSGRADDFDGFAINKSNIGTMDVYNSEELWWAVEHNYLPVFPLENSKAEAFYNKAKDILREIINDSMTEYEKALVIFEYLVDMVDYDYDAFNGDSDPATAHRNACYYLEGVFEYNRAVCDGKSKAFTLLCGIEGIECVRDWGAGIDGGVGHAWNYVELDGAWYMVDTTAGDAGTTLTNSINNTKVRAEIVDYDAFLCPVDLYDNGVWSNADPEYLISNVWDDVVTGDRSASLTDIYFDSPLDAAGNDFIIDSTEEYNLLIDTMLASMTSNTYTLKFAFSEDFVWGTNSIWDITDDAIDYTNVEYDVYGNKNPYLLIFTVVPAK